MRQELIKEIEMYQAYNEQEEMDKKVILDSLLSEEMIFERRDA